MGPLGMNISKILIEIQTFLLKTTFENVICKRVVILHQRHGAPDAQIINSSSGGDGKWAGGEDGQERKRIYPTCMWHRILWWTRVDNRHLRISSPRDSRKMAPPQASPYSLWPLSFICHQLVWPVQYTVYTWSWDHHRKWSLYQRPWDTWRRRPLLDWKHIESWPKYQDLGFAHVDPKSLSFHVRSYWGSTSLAVPPAIQIWWPGHQHSGFPMDILYKTLGRRLPELWWIVRGSGMSLCEHWLSQWTLHSSCNQHSLYFWHFHTCFVWAAPATPQHLHGWMPFPHPQRPCTVSCWQHWTFLVTGVQWLWHRWCCIQVKHHLLICDFLTSLPSLKKEFVPHLRT